MSLSLNYGVNFMTISLNIVIFHYPIKKLRGFEMSKYIKLTGNRSKCVSLFFLLIFWVQVIIYKKIILTTEDTFKIQCGDKAWNEITFRYNPKNLVFAFKLYCFYTTLIFFSDGEINEWMIIWKLWSGFQFRQFTPEKTGYLYISSQTMLSFYY